MTAGQSEELVEACVPVKLTAAERKLILEGLVSLEPACHRVVRETPRGEPVLMTPDDLETLSDCVQSEAYRSSAKSRKIRLGNLYDKLRKFRYQHVGPRTTSSLGSKLQPASPTPSGDLSSLGTNVMVQAMTSILNAIAHQLRGRDGVADDIDFTPGQRDVLLGIPTLAASTRAKLEGGQALTHTEIADLIVDTTGRLADCEPAELLPVLEVAQELTESLHRASVRASQSAIPVAATTRDENRLALTKTDNLYQFKITLLGIDPPIWRRIQVWDCTLDQLHFHIQTAMGWTNSHLHLFTINRENYGDPELLQNGFEDEGCRDSTRTLLSGILPKRGKRFRFRYEYDFGDDWEHEIVFEGSVLPEKGKRYPLCLEGARACPPEDIGGPYGYFDFLAAIDDPDHEYHEEFRDWGRTLDPEGFDPKKATRRMKKGLLDG